MMNWITLKLKNLAGNLKSVFAHFPLACMFSLAFSILFSFWMLNETIYDCEFSFIGVPFYTLLWGSGTAMILTFSADLFCYLREKLGWQRLVCNAVAVLLAAISAWIIYRQAESDFIVYYVFAMLFAVLLTMLSWPLLGKRCPEMLWNYHIRLFLTLAASTCLSMIAFAGIALVLLSIQFLFGIELERTYTVAFSICIAFLMPCCTMAMLPIRKEAYDKKATYNKWGKVLVLYILLPIVCLETIVLYIYALKILFAWQLPNGGVAYLVLEYAIIGSLVCYLMMPVFYAETLSKLRFFKRGFFISLLPLLVLLFVGLYRRIHEYGFTTNRYLVLLAACLFTILAIFLIVKNSVNVNSILISLGVISLLLLVGPWNMMILPKQAQLHRFERIATECHLIENGMIVPATDTLTWEQEQAISSSLDFFIIDNKTYRHEFTQRFFNMTIEETDSICSYLNSYGLRTILAKKMNITYRDQFITNTNEPQSYYCYFDPITEDKTIRNIAGYDFAFTTYFTFDREKKENLSYKNSLQISFWRDTKQQTLLHISVNNHPFIINVVDSLQLSYYLKGDEHSIHLSPTSIFHEDEQIKFRMDVKQLDFEKDSTGNYALSDFDFTGLVKLK